MPETLKVAICLSEGFTHSDFITPVEILTSLNLADHPYFEAEMGPDVPFRPIIEYVAPSLDPLAGSSPYTPLVIPTRTYKDVTDSGLQYDILWVPSSGLPRDPVTGEDKSSLEEIEFIKNQAPGARYILAVCGGSWLLAEAELLEGKRATTSKILFNYIVANTDKLNITWVPKARWVVDGKIWTSSGVTAGIDMAVAFVEHLVGPSVCRFIRGAMEIVDNGGPENDLFAAFHGLA